MDEDFLLTVETLSLNRDITRGAAVDKVFALKTRAADGYLVVNEDQHAILSAFQLPQTVPHMLGTAIFKRTCLELREFYELVLKAHRVGVLISTGTNVAVPARTARRWLPLPEKLTLGAFFLSLLVLLAGLVRQRPTLPSSLTDILLAWGAWIGGLSAGYLLATSTLKGAGGELLRPRWRWTLPIPHFSVDLRDACMRPKSVRVAILVGQLCPLVVLSGLGLMLEQAWAAGPLLGLLIFGNPIWGPVANLRRLLGGNQRLDTDRAFLFSTNRLPRRKLRSFFHGEGLRSAGWGLVFGLLWALVAIRVMYGGLNLSLLPALTDVSTLKWLGVGIGGGAALVGLGVIGWAAIVFVKRRGLRLWSRMRRLIGRWRATDNPMLDQSLLLKAMGQNAVFRSIPMPQQVDVARAFEVSRTRAWRTLQAIDREPTQVGLILKGSATVHRRGPKGRLQRVQRLKEGDIFGARALVDREKPKLEVRTRTPVVALMLPTPLYDEQVVRRLGMDRAFNLGEVCSFLRSLPLCQQWQLSSIMRMADLAQMKTYFPKDKLVAAGEDPRSFFVIFDGAVESRINGKTTAKMRAGDFFGEAELLQNSAVRQDVVAVEPTRCLCVPRSEFVRFVTHNYHVALSLERVASERLGRPVFPLQSSFEVR